MTQIKEFNNLDLMQTVRNNHLNPLIRRIETEIVPTLATLETEIHDSYKDVNLDVGTKVMKFDKGPGGFKEIDLKPIMPKFDGIGVQSLTGFGPSTGVKLIQFPDATITPSPSGESAAVGFDWTTIFQHNQKWPEVVLKSAVSHLKSLIFTGDTDAVTVAGENVTLRIPKMEPLLVTIPGKGGDYLKPAIIKSIELDGETSSSFIAGDKLTISLNAGGGGIANDNFKGFYETLGDLESKVTDPISGKSFAYVKDQTLGGKYYTAHYFVNGSWKELSQDPALTYNAPTAPLNQGVFSIKPSDKITIDSNGQINLDGLSTPQLPQYFVGFFDTLEQLKAEVPNPIVHQTHAYVKGPSGRGWLNYRADRQGSASMWNIVAPLGSFSFVDETAGSFTQVFGIKKNDAWELDSQGLLTMKGGGGGGGSGNLKVSVSGSDSQFETHDVTGMSFSKAKSMATFVGDKNQELYINHPQRVISYNNTFELAHNHRDYEGNIFYDETSRTWMGWGVPKDAGGVDNKWTRVFHPKMSDEVKDLNRRVPPKSPAVEPGILGDNAAWDHNGLTYIEQGNDQLPEDIRSVCGAYITTLVQDKDAAGITIPQYRMQTLVADKPEGGNYVRRFIKSPSPGSEFSWSPWIKTSFERADIVRHEKDPNAHKDIMKFYAVHALHGRIEDLQQQTMDGIPGAMRADGNYDVLADNYGHILLQQDRGSVPYDHWFTSEGVVELSGYTTSSYPVGKWTVHLRIRRKGSSTIEDLQKFSYVHTNDRERYPPMKFKGDKVELVRGDELYMHVYFDNPKGLINVHKDIYIVPVRSYISYQDSETAAGTLIASNYRKYFGNLDVTGEVAVKVHHRDIHDTTSGIRVYGTKVKKTPVDMNVG